MRRSSVYAKPFGRLKRLRKTNPEPKKDNSLVKAAIISSAVAAAALLINNYILSRSNEIIERQKLEFGLIQSATSTPSTVAAYCNVLIWKRAGLLRA